MFCSANRESDIVSVSKKILPNLNWRGSTSKSAAGNKWFAGFLIFLLLPERHVLHNEQKKLALLKVTLTRGSLRLKSREPQVQLDRRKSIESGMEALALSVCVT